MGFKVAILLQQLSPSGSGVCCPQPPCSGPGKHMLCYTGSWWIGVQGATYPERVASLYVLQRSRSLQFSIPGHSSAQLQAPLTNLCLAGQVPAQPSAFSLHPFLPHGFTSSYQAAWQILHTRPHDFFPYYPRLHGGIPGPLLFPPTLILNAWPRTSCMTSYLAPPMLCYFCQFSHILYLLLASVFSQGKCSR